MTDLLSILMYNYLKENDVQICTISNGQIISSDDPLKMLILPLEVTYTFKHLNRNLGCHEGMENISEYIRYFYLFDNLKEEITKKRIITTRRY